MSVIRIGFVLAGLTLALATPSQAEAHKWEVHNVLGWHLGTYNANPGPGWSFGRIFNEELHAFYYLADDPASAPDSPLRPWQYPMWCLGTNCDGACYTLFDPANGPPPPQGIFSAGTLPLPEGWNFSNTVVVSSSAYNSREGDPFGTYNSMFDGTSCRDEVGAPDDIPGHGAAPWMHVRLEWVPFFMNIEGLRYTPYQVRSVSLEQRVEELGREIQQLREELAR